jgi:hypothetical protein
MSIKGKTIQIIVPEPFKRTLSNQPKDISKTVRKAFQAYFDNPTNPEPRTTASLSIKVPVPLLERLQNEANSLGISFSDLARHILREAFPTPEPRSSSPKMNEPGNTSQKATYSNEDENDYQLALRAANENDSQQDNKAESRARFDAAARENFLSNLESELDSWRMIQAADFRATILTNELEDCGEE